MSAGHHRGEITAEHERELDRYLAIPKFRKAVAAYRKEDDSHDIPYLGGSNNSGDTVYFDRNLPRTISVMGQKTNPRPFLKEHEAVEGALIRLYGLKYPEAHLIATAAERRAVRKALGKNAWGAYERALEPCIRADELENGKGMPPDLLMAPYKGSKFERGHHGSVS